MGLQIFICTHIIVLTPILLMRVTSSDPRQLLYLCNNGYVTSSEAYVIMASGKPFKARKISDL